MYAYIAVSPIDGHIDYTIQPFLDSENVSKFLKYLSEQHRKEEIFLVWDGARAHTGVEVVMPSNIHTILLPPRSPRLNPVESFWGELREKFFHIFTFESIPALMYYLMLSLCMIKNDKWKLKRMLGFNWSNMIILNAT